MRGGYKDAHISLQQQLIFHTQLTQNSEKLSNVSSWNIIVILRNVILECENIWLLVYDRAIEAPDTRPALKTLTKKKKTLFLFFAGGTCMQKDEVSHYLHMVSE